MYYLILSFFVLFTSAIEIKYIKLNDNTRTKITVNTSTPHISEDVLEDAVWWIFMDKNTDEDSIESISNFTHLGHVDISDIGLDLMPTFRDLPSIFSVSVKGNDVSYIKKEALGSIAVKEIFLVNNKITKIEPRSFGQEVHTLHLSCNKLKKLYPRWFQNPGHLKELDISGNEIISLPENLFKNFTELEHITLSHNKIAKIGLGTFANRAIFSTIKLDHNKILELRAEYFLPGLIKISSLHIEYNLLSFLDKDFLEKVNKTKAVIFGNPWQCSCYPDIKKWSTAEDIQYSYDYNYGNSDYEYEYEYVIKVKKAPKEDSKCMNITSTENCSYNIDLHMIEEYQKNTTKRETTEHFCKKLKKD